MPRSLASYLIIAGLAAQPARAQDIDQMARRVDSLHRAATAARDAVRTYRLTHHQRFDYADSAVILGGKVRIYFNSDLAQVSHAGAAEAEKQLTQLGRALDRMAPLVFTVVPDSAQNLYDARYDRTRAINVRQHFETAPNSPNRTSTESDPRSIAMVITTAVSRNAGASSVANWASGIIDLAPAFSPKLDWASLRLSIVSSPSHTGRSCFLGDIRACRLFLALDTTPDPIHILFDSVGRQKIVLYEGDRSVRASAVGTDRCLHGNDEACVAVMQRMDMSALAGPFVRSSLATHALAVGGPQAAERMVLANATGTKGALAAAANEPLDSLIADWQRHLSERSGTSSNLQLTIAISSLVWIGVCVFLALRSSRWR